MQQSLFEVCFGLLAKAKCPHRAPSQIPCDVDLRLGKLLAFSIIVVPQYTPGWPSGAVCVCVSLSPDTLARKLPLSFSLSECRVHIGAWCRWQFREARGSDTFSGSLFCGVCMCVCVCKAASLTCAGCSKNPSLDPLPSPVSCSFLGLCGFGSASARG